MEKEIVQEIVRKRVQENQNLFTKEELEFIEGNNILVTKMYLLGNMDCYIVNVKKCK